MNSKPEFDAAPIKPVPTVGLRTFFPPALLFDLRYRQLDMLAEVAESHDIARLGWAGSPLYYVSEPHLMKDVLLDTQSFIKGTILKKLEIIIGRGLITLNGEEWRDARRRVQKIFHKGVLLAQSQIIFRHTQEVIARLNSTAGTTVNLDRVMNELTFKIALELFVGAGDDVLDDMDELQWAIDELNAYAKWRLWSFIPHTWKTRRNNRFRKAIGVLDAVVEKVIASRLTDTAAHRADRSDVLSLLLEAGFEGKPLRDHVMTMLIAGHETTGTTLSFLWAHVARQPSVQDSLFKEACEVSDEITPDSLPYTRAVWNEILRLYPAVPVLDRTAVQDVDLRGYKIPAGANVLWSPYVLHRSKKYWPTRKDPNEFDPDAMLREDPLPGTFVPFGEGPRMCLGKTLADLEAMIIVSLFARAFQIRTADDGPLRMKTLVTLRPLGGVPVILKPRSSSTNRPSPRDQFCDESHVPELADLVSST
jgi:cytochrome P450